MLILTRKNGEAIQIGEDIEIKILELVDGRAKIGIEAPRELKVLRKEVMGTIDANKEAGKHHPKKSELMELLKNKK